MGTAETLKGDKMKTSYINCHPEIAESLQRGEHIRCYIREVAKSKRYRTIIAYVNGNYIDHNLVKLIHEQCEVTMIKKETYVIDAISMMKGLIERGYQVSEKGNWKLKDKVFYVNWWQLCDEDNFVDGCFEDWMLWEREVE